MNRKGFTVMELVIGLGTAAILGLVSASLFKAGMLTYNYMSRQNKALASSIKALSGDGSRSGILRTARAAKSVQSLGSTTMTFVSTASATTAFTLGGTNLTYTTSAGTKVQATDISTMTLGYYNFNTGTGRLIQSTAAASATLITVQLDMKGKSGTQKDYNFFSGAWMRNHE
jgi:hypothetical protein